MVTILLFTIWWTRLSIFCDNIVRENAKAGDVQRPAHDIHINNSWGAGTAWPLATSVPINSGPFGTIRPLDLWTLRPLLGCFGPFLWDASAHCFFFFHLLCLIRTTFRGVVEKGRSVPEKGRADPGPSWPSIAYMTLYFMHFTPKNVAAWYHPIND